MLWKTLKWGQKDQTATVKKEAKLKTGEEETKQAAATSATQGQFC